MQSKVETDKLRQELDAAQSELQAVRALVSDGVGRARQDGGGDSGGGGVGGEPLRLCLQGMCVCAQLRCET